MTTHIGPACALPSGSSSRPPNPDDQRTDTATSPSSDRDPPPLGLDQIGYEAADLATIRRAIHAPDGLVLVVGPSGSGRRTALYSMLEQVDPVRRSIQTIESSVLRRSEEHTSELQSRRDLVCRLLLEK